LIDLLVFVAAQHVETTGLRSSRFLGLKNSFEMLKVN